MEKTGKLFYVEPSVILIELRQEGVICGSLGDRGNYDQTDENPFA